MVDLVDYIPFRLSWAWRSNPTPGLLVHMVHMCLCVWDSLFLLTKNYFFLIMLWLHCLQPDRINPGKAYSRISNTERMSYLFLSVAAWAVGVCLLGWSVFLVHSLMVFVLAVEAGAKILVSCRTGLSVNTQIKSQSELWEQTFFQGILIG